MELYLGKRVLYRMKGDGEVFGELDEGVFEGKVLEISPSGKYFLLATGEERDWFTEGEIEVVEVLPDDPRRKPHTSGG